MQAQAQTQFETLVQQQVRDTRGLAEGAFQLSDTANKTAKAMDNNIWQLG